MCVCVCVYIHQAPLFIDFLRQEYLGLPFPSQGHLPDPGIKPTSPACQVASLPLSHLGSLYVCIYMCVCVCV